MDVKLRQFVRVRAGQHCEYCELPQVAYSILAGIGGSIILPMRNKMPLEPHR